MLCVVGAGILAVLVGIALGENLVLAAPAVDALWPLPEIQEELAELLLSGPLLGILAIVEPTLAGSAVVITLTFVFGLVSCRLLTRTGTLLACVVFHMVINAAATVELYVGHFLLH